jgi:hypothetical protein
VRSMFVLDAARSFQDATVVEKVCSRMKVRAA